MENKEFHFYSKLVDSSISKFYPNVKILYKLHFDDDYSISSIENPISNHERERERKRMFLLTLKKVRQEPSTLGP